MSAERRVVDNRVLLLGLDKLYRDAIKPHERGELLTCARRVADEIQATAADVPVEGYYSEDAQLTEYFRLVRALQEVDGGAASLVDSLGEFQRLLDVASAPLYGDPQQSGKLLPLGRDALSQALLDNSPKWTLEGLTAAAHRRAQASDEFSLVGLAARAQDAVVLAALRESVVLYAERVNTGIGLPPTRPRYVWRVDDDLAQHASRFVNTFNSLFGEQLPPPAPEQAEHYWLACDSNEILGRCARLGHDDTTSPVRHYHWAICRGAYGQFMVQEFWASEVWTTARYNSAIRPGGQRLAL